MCQGGYIKNSISRGKSKGVGGMSKGVGGFSKGIESQTKGVYRVFQRGVGVCPTEVYQECNSKADWGMSKD